MTEREGRCLCGAVQYRVQGEPLVARICWCQVCQKISANGTVNAMFPTSALGVSGETAHYSSVADSGNVITREFCPRCGCHLYAGSSANPHVRVLRIGTLDDPSSVRPTLNIWTASAPAWACLDPALAMVAGQPAPAKVVADPGS